MARGSSDRSAGAGLVSGLRRAIDGNLVGMAFVGLLAGYSLSVLGTDVVSLPVAGPAPGLAVGAVGLSIAIGAYSRLGCCGECGSRSFGLSSDCGCTDDCGDSCSYDP